ncbi:DUF4257 domain-containing protein [Sutcliffiella sp. NPDC057660]|uniref:DUF4257 domain-containing protein n=1 Tax=Sutcliffiella sp. NPDC057660 TaxID=3346199 RepID=UPI003684E6CF
MLETIGLAGLVGGVTGLIAHLIRHEKSLIYPKKIKRPKSLHLGFLADVLIGALAAIFTTHYLFNPSDNRELLGIAIMAGMAAENVLLYKELNTERAKADELNKLNDRLGR